MHLDLRPSKSSELVPFQSCCVGALDSCEFTNMRSGLSEDGSLTWLYKGAALEVVSTGTGHRVASLNAQHLLRDQEAMVTCVGEFPCQGRPRLLVALQGSAEQGMVVLLDVPSSMIVKAVEIPNHVTAVERVLTYGGSSVPSWAFSEQLRQFYGIVAVGTEGGYVYLVDLALDWTYSVDGSQKISPCPLRLLDPRERDIQSIRQLAFRTGQHVAVRLGGDEQSHSNDCFHFRGPDLTVRQSFNEDEVHVSSLKYIPQSGSLAIGYSFGGFHLWKLFNPVIEYASTVEAEDLPVAFFVYQEPENDPKNFAYLWVCRDDRLSEQKQESICSMALYQLSYSRRTFYANYGSFFEELNLLTLRLDHHLTVEPYNNRNTTTWSSQLLSAFVFTDPNYRPPAGITINDSFEDGCQGPDLSLCAFVWEAQDSRPGSRSEVFLAVFDMNRWYHAQMPSRIKCVNVGGQEVCPFLAVYRMNDAVYKEGCENLVDMQLKPGSLLRFVNNSPMPLEQHYYPSSLAFDTVCVLSSGIVTTTVLGIQRQVLASLDSSGPSCLLKPFDVYHRCLQAGLLARSADTSFSSAALSTDEQQRMALLTLALEQGQIRFITSCINSWADGDYVQQGCTLQFLLSWAWARVTAIKQQIDLTCQPLFDWSEAPVDQRMLLVLQNCLCCLGHLRTVLHTLLTQGTSPVSLQGQEELEYRIRVVTLLYYHLKVMLWFVHSSLLPEHEDAGKSSPMHYIYPAKELAQVFAERRQQMKQNPRATNTHEMILIDALVHSAGETLTELWRNEEGTGMYPPPNLHTALSMYLLDQVEEKTKNAIMLYLLFDMAAVAHGQQEEFAEKIPRFARTFDLPLGLVQQIHGFWLIDHMDFQEGLNQLRLRSGQELGPWQHQCILRALMHQGEAASALRYLSLRNPPLLTSDDLKMRLSILMTNRLVSQALAFVRNSCGPGDQEQMLRHIFSLCQQQKLMNVLLKLPLIDKEEKCLQSYLSENTDSAATELMVLHLLQRAQYVPAIRLNDRMKHRATMDMSNKTRERSKTRNNIVEGFRQSLPATQQYLINNPPAPTKIASTRKIEVPRPKPLSTVVTKREERRANSKSTMILAVMDKVTEAGNLIAEEEGLDDREEEEVAVVPPHPRSLLSHQNESADRDPVVVNKSGPFLCTPTTTPRQYLRRSLTGQVIFPAVKEVTQALLSSAKKFASPVSPTSTRRSQMFTADCMSLLQTPKIDHTPARVPSPARPTTTPHSILKMSRLPRSSPRTLGVSHSPRGKPKRLGFSASMTLSPPLPSTPTTLTPSSTPSPTSAAEPMSFKAASMDQSKADKNASEMATPKQIRFSEPEIREISPPYVSPDNLGRPPLHSPLEEGEEAAQDQDSMQQERASSGEAMSQSDDEIVFNVSHQVADEEVTFNISQHVAEPMEAETESDSSTLPVATPSPTVDKIPHVAATSSPASAPSSEPLSLQMEHKDPTHPHQLQQSEQNILPDSSPRSRLLRTSVHERDAEKDRDRSPLSVRTSVESETRSQRQRLSPLGSSTSFSLSKVHEQQTVTRTSVFTSETKHVSEERTEFHETKIVSEESVASGKESMAAKNSPPLPIIECVEESKALPAQSAEAMETIEPAEGNILEEAREAGSTGGKQKAVEEVDHSETVEVAGEDDVLDLEVQVPTPIRRSSRRNTPERSVRSSRTVRRTGAKIDLTTVDKEQTKSEPTPPKLRRVSPSREKTSDEVEWREAMPSLQLEVSDDDNTNENHTRPTPPPSPGRSRRRSSSSSREQGVADVPGLLMESPGRAGASRSPPVSPSLRSTKSSKKSRPVLPLLKTAGSVEKSPPVSPTIKQDEKRSPPISPSRRSTRSVDRSPPVSPSRISARNVDRSPPVSPSRRSTRSVDRSPPVSPSRRSTRSVDRSPPASPSRKPSRSEDSSQPRSPSRRSTQSADRSPPPSPSRASRRKNMEELTVQTESSGEDVMPPPVSPARRSTRLRTPERSPGRKKTPERTTTTKAQSSEISNKTSQPPTGAVDESQADDSVARSPSRRSQRSKTPDPIKPPTKKAAAMASEQSGEAEASTSQRDTTEPETPGSPSRRSTRRSKTPDRATPEPASPSRRTNQRRKTSERSDDAMDASPSRSQKDETRSRNPSRGEESSPMASDDKVPEKVTPASPSRRSSRSRSKTPELSPGRVATRLREKGKPESITEEVKDIATATDEVRTMRKQQRDASPRASPYASSLAQETGDAPSFQFAAPTPLSRVHADSVFASPLEVPAFIFSPPIARSTRTRRGSASSTSTSKSTRSRSRKESGSVHEESMDVAPEVDQSTSEDKPETTTTKKTTNAKGGRKTKTRTTTTTMPTASPSDSPVNLVSPGEPGSSESSHDLAAKGVSRRTQQTGATRTRVLRKRKAKLW